MQIEIPEMTPVESSQIESVGHDPVTNTLFLKFHRGGIYSYADVPAEKHARMMASESKGKFLGAEIKPHHSFAKH